MHMADDDSDISYLSDGESAGSATPARHGSRRNRRAPSRRLPQNRPDSDGDDMDDYAYGSGPGNDTSGGFSPQTAATSWQEVDREELSSTALKLISSAASTAPTDDKGRDALYLPLPLLSVVVEPPELTDPLGLGRIDLMAMRLERERPTSPATGDTSSPAGSSSSRLTAGRSEAKTRSKGVVGRFISELTKTPGRPPGAGGGGRPAGAAAQPGGGTPERGQHVANSQSMRRMSGAAGRALMLPPSKLLPNGSAFDPDAYLAVFHGDSSALELQQGLQALERELGERTGQLKQLVKQNFEHFISCKTTINDIYSRLQRIESDATGVSTQVLYNAVQEAQGSAKRAFGPVLERQAKAQRIKSVLALMRRFHTLFDMPARVTALAAARDYEQVLSEYKKANGLIKPSSTTPRVWTSLHQEIERHVGDAYLQLLGELQEASLPPASVPDLILLALDPVLEGLPAAAAGGDPLERFVAGREAAFAGSVAAAEEEHARAMGRLRERMLAAGGAPSPAGGGSAGGGALPSEGAPKASGLSKVLDAAVLAWRDDPELEQLLPPARRRAAGVAAAQHSWRQPGGGGGGFPGLSPPPPLASRLVPHTAPTSGQWLLLQHLGRLCGVLLATLPSLWRVAGSSRLAGAQELPAATRGRLGRALAGAAQVGERLVGEVCGKLSAVVGALAGVGPMQECLELAVEELASTCRQLSELKVPPGVAAAVRGVLLSALELGVKGVCEHMAAAPAQLLAGETWQLSLTHASSEPVTHLPEQLQEEVAVSMHHYKALMQHCSPLGDVPPNISSAPLQSAFFRTFDAFCKSGVALAQQLRAPPTLGLASTAGGGGGGGTTGCAAGPASPGAARVGSGTAIAATASGGSASSAASFQQLLLDDLDDELRGSGAAAGANSGGGASAAVGRVAASDDVKLLTLASNTGFVRNRLMASLAQRYLLLLAGEGSQAQAQVDRCIRAVKTLAGRMDAATKAMLDAYQERKRRHLDRLLSGYVRADISAVGAPPQLHEVSPSCQQLVHALINVQAELHMHARQHMQALLPPLLGHLAQQLSARLASGLPSSSWPPEVLAQCFLDLAWLDAVLSKTGPASMRAELDATYALLAQRIVSASTSGGAAAGAAGDSNGAASCSPASTPLARSLAGLKDPGEVCKRLQASCRQLVPQIISRSAFTIRCIMNGP